MSLLKRIDANYKPTVGDILGGSGSSDFDGRRHFKVGKVVKTDNDIIITFAINGHVNESGQRCKLAPLDHQREYNRCNCYIYKTVLEAHSHNLSKLLKNSEQPNGYYDYIGYIWYQRNYRLDQNLQKPKTRFSVLK